MEEIKWECDVLKMLNYVNVVKLYIVLFFKGFLFIIIMEFLYCDLEKFIKEFIFLLKILNMNLVCIVLDVI